MSNKLEGSGGSQIKIPSQHVPGGTKENHKTIVRKAGVPGDIRNRHEGYHYTNFLGDTTSAVLYIDP
jgi:hypothetical protein